MGMMTDEEFLGSRFESERPRLRQVAYRMLGSSTEADDAVQEAWLRLSRSDAGSVEDLPAWLTTVVARVCLNMLRTRRSRDERPLDDAVGRAPSDGHRVDPEQEAVLADSVGLALLVVLDSLSPAERLAFVLHDMFDLPFDEIAPIVGRSSQATRQLASRARRRVRGAAVPERDQARQRRVVDAYLAATREGDFEGLMAVLDPDVVLRSDAEAMPGGLPVLLRGARDVAAAAMASAPRAWRSEVALIDGSAGILMAPRGRLQVALLFEIAGDRVTSIDVVAAPDRLAALEIALP
ncbi:MAG: sigma-70 family RNA polymerase sigma factor [Nocardioidaceae bacterium]